MLQCLLHQPALCHYLASIHAAPLSDGHEDQECTVCALQTLWEAYWRKSSTKLSPKRGLNAETSSVNNALLHELPKNSSDFERDLRRKPPSQSDPYELLVHLLDCLKEHETRDTAIGESLKGESATSEAGADQLPSLSELFEVTLEQQWKCSDCGNVAKRFLSPAEAGHGIGLQVSLQEPRSDLSLVEYLRLNTFVATLTIRCEDGECEQVGDETEGRSRQLRRIIRKAPEILTIHLSRFAFNAKYQPIKLSNACPFEEYLNLGEFTEEEEPLIYRLDGVVAHKGNLQGDHYIAAVREQDGKNFRTINDGSPGAKVGTVDDLERPYWKTTDFDPYVLVYSKV